MVQTLQDPVSVVIAFSEPYDYTLCQLVDIRHYIDLLVSLLYVSLVDANCINPYRKAIKFSHSAP